MTQIKIINYILRGKNRQKVLTSLSLEAKNISFLSKELNLSNSNIRRTIRQLEEKNLIVCDDQTKYHYKYYELTNLGNEVLKKVKLLKE